MSAQKTVPRCWYCFRRATPENDAIHQRFCDHWILSHCVLKRSSTGHLVTDSSRLAGQQFLLESQKLHSSCETRDLQLFIPYMIREESQ